MEMNWMTIAAYILGGLLPLVLIGGQCILMYGLYRIYFKK